MKVQELIDYLQKLPPTIQQAYDVYTFDAEPTHDEQGKDIHISHKDFTVGISIELPLTKS